MSQASREVKVASETWRTMRPLTRESARIRELKVISRREDWWKVCAMVLRKVWV